VDHKGCIICAVSCVESSLLVAYRMLIIFVINLVKMVMNSGKFELKCGPCLQEVLCGCI
jgi:hypothetical protein